MNNNDLSRFRDAHERYFNIALKEISSGRKVSHWMWYIFPQIQGLGRSSTSQYYAIQNLEEARLFLQDPYLGGNLIEICTVLLELKTDSPTCVFGKPDDMKLRSCMTLFSVIAEGNSVFDRVLEKYFSGRLDELTLRILGIHNK